jgi:hypothetical protein
VLNSPSNLQMGILCLSVSMVFAPKSLTKRMPTLQRLETSTRGGSSWNQGPSKYPYKTVLLSIGQSSSSHAGNTSSEDHEHFMHSKETPKAGLLTAPTVQPSMSCRVFSTGALRPSYRLPRWSTRRTFVRCFYSWSNTWSKDEGRDYLIV